MTPFAQTDGSGIVTAAGCQETPPNGAITIDAATLAAIQVLGVGRCILVNDALAAYAPPVTPPPMPDISDRQFARGLWGDGVIAYSDFLGFIGPGSIPAPLQAIVNLLPDDDTGAPTPRKDAVGFLTGSKLYNFTHPLVEVVRQAMAAQDAKWTPAYLRTRWLAWSTL